MAHANTLKVFEILRESFDEKQATKIAEAVDTALETNNVVLLNEVALKDDIAELKASTKADLIELKASTKADLAEAKTEIITTILKWMFIFWIGQFASIVGVITAILFAFFKK